jgi:hypothetical protein
MAPCDNSINSGILWSCASEMTSMEENIISVCLRLVGLESRGPDPTPGIGAAVVTDAAAVTLSVSGSLSAVVAEALSDAGM